MTSLDNFYNFYKVNPEKAKFELVQKATEKIFKAVQENYYTREDLDVINYSEVCEWCGFPDFQDGGLFEQAIDIAASTVRKIMN